jgi:hypothetical protein
MAAMAGESFWSWERSTAHYKAALIKIIAELFVLARIVPGEVPDTASQDIWNISLPRYAYRRALELLKPAESALRRLIIMGAHGKSFAPATAKDQPGKADAVGDTVSGQGGTLTDADSAPSDAPASEKSLRAPAFNIFDPLRQFTFRSFDSFEDYALWKAEQDANPLIIPPAGPRMAPVNALSLWRRIQAMHHAAENFDQYVTRYVRWRGQRKFKIAHQRPLKGRRPATLMRPGRAPGYIRKGKHEIHDLLRDVDNLAADSENPPKWRNSG